MNKTFLAAVATTAALLVSTPAFAQDAATAPAPAPVADPDGFDYTDIEVARPEFDEPFRRDGQLLPPATILRVVPGTPADEVRALLGNPLKTGQGRRGPEWDYNLKLDLADHDYIVCQYKVILDDRGERVAETVWRRYQCRDAIAAHAAAE